MANRKAALEAKLLENPEDDATLSELVAVLAGAKDIRGQLGRLQLARQKVETIVERIRDEDEKTILGSFATDESSTSIEMRDGLVDTARIPPSRLEELLALRAGRLVRRLALVISDEAEAAILERAIDRLTERPFPALHALEINRYVAAEHDLARHAATLAYLDELHLTGSSTSRSDIKRCLAAVWPSLTHLTLALEEEAKLTIADLKPLLDRKCCPRLEHLALAEGFATKLVAKLSGSKLLPALKSLDLSEAQVDDRVALAIGKARASYAHLDLLIVFDGSRTTADVTDRIGSKGHKALYGVAKEVRGLLTPAVLAAYEQTAREATRSSRYEEISE